MKRSHPVLLVLAVLLLTASLPASAQKGQTVHLDRTATVGGASLAPGDYRLELAPSLETVTLYSGKRAVVTSRCKVGLAAGRVYGDAVHFTPAGDGREVVTKLVFSASKLSIEILPPAVDESPVAKAEGETSSR